MVFITSMIIALIMYEWPENGIALAVVIAFIIEFINILVITSGVKKIEKRVEEKYIKTITEIKKTIEDDYKKAEIYKQEADRWKKLFEKKSSGN